MTASARERDVLAGHPHLADVVARARRRLRARAALQAAGPALVAAGGLALAWALLARALLLPAVGGQVALLLGLGAALPIARASARRVSTAHAAWAADRWLATREAFATAVQSLSAGHPAPGVPALQVAAAEARAADVGPLPGPPRRPIRLLGLGAALLLAAAALEALPNPQDVVRAEREADREAVAGAAQDLAEAGEGIGEGPAAPERAALAAELEQLAAVLPDDELEAALERLEAARADLAGRIDPDLAGQRTALSGLAQELGREPLAAGATVQEQLGQLAADVEGGSVPDADALAERLQALADALPAAPGGVSEGLRAAGRALAAGSPSAAAGALRGAAGAVSDAVTGLDGQAALAQAAGAAEAAAGRLRDRQLARGDGDRGLADGSGAGQGEAGNGGQGQGSGQGQGQGAGQGQGGGGGAGAAGDIAAGGGGDQDGGRGGDGRAAGGEDQPGEGEADLPTVFDPGRGRGEPGEELPLHGTTGAGGSELEIGTVRGAGQRNTGLVPYRDALPAYAAEAARTIEQPGYPLRLRTTVRDYFDRLGGRP